MKLRPYQQDLKNKILAAWSDGHRNVLAVMPTGAGKTLTVSDIMNDHVGSGIAVAHRAELIIQMSLAFARQGIRHRIIGPAALSRTCVQIHIADLKRSFIDPQSRMMVSSAQTLARYKPEPWMSEVTLGACDESHHVLAKNQWGKVLDLFPNARWLLPTATPLRSDGAGLGRHADGVADIMILGPQMRELINAKWLCEYRIYAPQSDIDLAAVAISASGDFSPKPLADAVHASKTIVGDVVSHYLRLAKGKRGITFCVDVESATEMAAAYRAAGVPAETLSANTIPTLRANIMQRLRDGTILQVTNCDILGEGVDVPTVEVVSMARPTNSYGLYVQQFGRCLRPYPGKTHGILIDHSGNVLRHGLVDAPRVWSLDRREKRSSGKPADDVIPLRTCLNPECLTVYERIHAACPECGTIPVPAARGTPEAVDGALAEFSPELLARLRGEIDKPLTIPYGAEPAVVGACKKRHRERTEAQEELRRVMAIWGGWRVLEGDTDDMQQRRFFLTMGVDVMSAQALNRADADALRGRVCNVLTNASIVWEDATSINKGE